MGLWVDCHSTRIVKLEIGSPTESEAGSGQLVEVHYTNHDLQ